MDKLVTVKGILLALTDKAALMKFQDNAQHWIPRSQIDTARPRLGIHVLNLQCELDIPKWLAMKIEQDFEEDDE